MFSFFNDTATTEIYSLSLHDALPISRQLKPQRNRLSIKLRAATYRVFRPVLFLHCNRISAALPARSTTTKMLFPAPNRNSVADRKSTRLNSSHQIISYPVFCFKKKNT